MSASVLNLTPVAPAIGAVIHDIDLNRIDGETQAAIRQALLDYQVVFFRNQKLPAHAQAALARQFGSLHIHPIFPSVAGVPEVIVLDSHLLDLRDNELWHTDVTFSRTPPLGCVLQAIKIPPTGGDTLWASGTAAFKALDPALQQKLKGLTAQYLITGSYRVKTGDTVLVHAAAGGVGLILGQWLASLGLTPIGTAGGPDKVAVGVMASGSTTSSSSAGRRSSRAKACARAKASANAAVSSTRAP